MEAHEYEKLEPKMQQLIIETDEENFLPMNNRSAHYADSSVNLIFGSNTQSATDIDLEQKREV